MHQKVHQSHLIYRYHRHRHRHRHRKCHRHRHLKCHRHCQCHRHRHRQCCHRHRHRHRHRQCQCHRQSHRQCHRHDKGSNIIIFSLSASCVLKTAWGSTSGCAGWRVGLAEHRGVKLWRGYILALLYFTYYTGPLTEK